MARGRMISKSLSTSKKYAALYPLPLGEFCQALYPLLVAHADDFGRLEGNVFTVKHSVVPASPRPENEIQEALAILHDVHLVIWYEVRSESFLQIVDFERHQIGLHKRTASRFPRVPGKSGKIRRVPLQLNRTELKGTEGKGSTSSALRAPSQQPVEDPKDNLSVITRVAHDVIDQIGETSPDLPEAVKSRCATLRIDYRSDVINTAIDSAIAQKRAARAS